MIRILSILFLISMLYACPFESNLPLEKGPVEAVDTSLTGFWYGIVKDGSDFFGIEALEISRQSDSLYSIIRYGKSVKGDMIMPDTAYLTGFSSKAGEQNFMNVAGKSTEPGPGKTIYYLAAFNRHHDTLQVRAVTETFTTRKFFKKPEELKQLVVDMSQKKNIYDELFTLSYRKIVKPASFLP